MRPCPSGMLYVNYASMKCCLISLSSRCFLSAAQKRLQDSLLLLQAIIVRYLEKAEKNSSL